MPVFDYGRFVYGGIKLTFFIGFLTYFYVSLSDYSGYINVFIDGALNEIGALTNLDLGCFMDGLGGTAFLNSIINQCYIVGGLLVSAVGSILTTKYIILFFQLFMRV